MQKALILIDYINEICHPEGKISGCAAMMVQEHVVDKVNTLLKSVRKNNFLVIWIVVAFDKNYYEANANSPIFSRAKKYQALQRNTWGTELLENLDYQKDELIIVKNVVNPFYATNLDHILRNQQVEEIYLAGVSTEVAIQSCTRDAHDRGYKVNVLSDCCASSNLDYHNASLAMLSNMANIIKSDQI
jgi:ureidoacrylate peracid hydrolase